MRTRKHKKHEDGGLKKGNDEEEEENGDRCAEKEKYNS